MRFSGVEWCVVAGSVWLLAGCAAIEKGGAYTRMSGESMTDYSKKNEGFVGTMAGVGGAINTTVGGAMENAAKGSGGASANTGKTETAAAAPAAKAPEPMSIADMQKRLAALGYPVGAADGVMGKKAVDALKAFQKDNKLAVTGELNNETIAKLRAAKSSG
jgi:Putative peptidoglycan binding domain